MDQPTPFPGKTQSLKSKTNRKATEAPKTNAKEKPINSRRRVFGTARNPNVPAKTVTEKPMIKLNGGVSHKQPKSAHKIPSTTDITPIPVTETAPEENRARPKKKSVCFQEKVGKAIAKNSPDGSTVAARTPVRSPSLVKPRVSGTPYISAERCSNCRFDKLETSSYWLGQIKLAESVGKHFVSVAFFRLAFESKAEPFRNLCLGLKRYLARHEYLSGQTEWREVSRSYGLQLKDDENETVEVDSGSGYVGTSNAANGSTDDEQEKRESKEQMAQVSEAN